MTGKIQALVACQIDDCAVEVSYPLDLVRMFKGKPICEVCHHYHAPKAQTGTLEWDDLPPVRLEDLKA